MTRMPSGFSLVEAMTALAILAVIVTVGIPSFARVQQRWRAAAILHETTASLALARLEAVKRGTTVVLCPSHDGHRCRTDGIWEDGWLIATENRRDRSLGARVRHIVPSAGTLRLRGTAGRPRLRFEPTGWSAGSNATLRLCDAGTLLGKVVLNNGGRARIERADRPSAECR